MKRLFTVLLTLIFAAFTAACSPFAGQPSEDGTSASHHFSTQRLDGAKELKKVDPFGDPPEELEKILTGNLMWDADAFDGCFFRYVKDKEGNTVSLERYDRYGEKTASIVMPGGAFYYYVRVLTTTEDGGFLFVRGYSDQYIYDEKKYASDLGAETIIVKCGAQGGEEWRITTDTEGHAYEFGFETEDGYLLCGTKEEPEEKGNYSSTDIYLTKLSKNGKIIKTRNIGGSNFDRVNYAEPYAGGFLIDAFAQSTDGDFENVDKMVSTRDYTVTVDGELNTVDILPKNDAVFRQYVGIFGGKRIDDRSSMFDAYPYGWGVSALLEYDGYYVVVSRNAFGVKETPPQVSMVGLECETVYAGYDAEGNVLWVKTVKE